MAKSASVQYLHHPLLEGDDEGEPDGPNENHAMVDGLRSDWIFSWDSSCVMDSAAAFTEVFAKSSDIYMAKKGQAHTLILL